MAILKPCSKIEQFSYSQNSLTVSTEILIKQKDIYHFVWKEILFILFWWWYSQRHVILHQSFTLQNWSSPVNYSSSLTPHWVLRCTK